MKSDDKIKKKREKKVKRYDSSYGETSQSDFQTNHQQASSTIYQHYFNLRLHMLYHRC